MSGKKLVDQQERDSAYTEFRQEWGVLSVYERYIQLKALFEAEQSEGKSEKIIIRNLARALNQNQDNIIAHLGIGRARKKILDLLKRDVMDLDVAYKIQKTLERRNDIPENELFERLRQITDEKNEEAENITISIFREILQEFLLDSSKNWRDRMALCRINEKWEGEGEAFKGHELIYIPTELLADDEAKFFHVWSDEAFVAVKMRDAMRPAKVSIEAIEPHDFYRDQKNDLYGQLTRWRSGKLCLDPTGIAEILNELIEPERKSNVTTKNKGGKIVAKNSFIPEQKVSHYLSLLKLNKSLQQRVDKKTMTLAAATELVQKRKEHEGEIDFDEIEKQLLRKRKIGIQNVRTLVNKALKTSSSGPPISENPDSHDQLS